MDFEQIKELITLIDSSDLAFFELSDGLFHSLKHPKRVKSFYEETTAIYDIIDYFKLDEKTGL